MVRLASFVALAAVAGTAVAAFPHQGDQQAVARSLDKRGLLSWLGLGEDKTAKEEGLESLDTDWTSSEDVGFYGLMFVGYDAKEARDNNTVCAKDCNNFIEAASVCNDNSTYNCYCDKNVTEKIQTCSSCIGNTTITGAKNFTSMCEKEGFKVDAAGASALLAQGGLAAALVAGGIALLF